MSAVFLACALACLPAEGGDKLIEQLDADFEALLKKERDPQPLRKAARLLKETNQSSTWTNYSSACAILRQARSKAAVPLLLKYMIQHAGYSTGHVVVPEYASTVEQLTGKELGTVYFSTADRSKRTRNAVEGLVKAWWTPNKDTIATDLSKMTDEQVQVITGRLLKRVAWAVSRSDGERGPTADGVYYLLGHVLGGEAGSLSREAHPLMVPAILARAGYVKGGKGAGAGARDTSPFPYEAVPLLGALRKDGEAPDLHRVALDERQGPAVRLLCLLALRAAGEDLRAGGLLSVLEKEKRLERRLVAILALEKAADGDKAHRKLLELMDDPNEEVRTAAVYALQGSAPPQALPKLKRVLDDLRPSRAVRTALRTLGKMDTDRAKATLASFLEAALEDNKRAYYLSDALGAFETATGKRWTGAGAHPDSYYRDKAKEALKWWRVNK